MLHMTSMNLTNLMVDERRQWQKATNCMIPFVLTIQNRQGYRDRTRLVDTQGWGGVDGELSKMYGVSFWGDENDCGDNCTTLNTPKPTDFCTSNGWTGWYEIYISIHLLKNWVRKAQTGKMFLRVSKKKTHNPIKIKKEAIDTFQIGFPNG